MCLPVHVCFFICLQSTKQVLTDSVEFPQKWKTVNYSIQLVFGDSRNHEPDLDPHKESALDPSYKITEAFANGYLDLVVKRDLISECLNFDGDENHDRYWIKKKTRIMGFVHVECF